MRKENFLLYKDYKPNVDILSDEQAGKLFKAIFAYVEDRTLPQFKDGMLRMAFEFIKNQLERDLEKYKETVEKNRINGAKGGRPKKEENPKNPKKAKKPSGLNGNPKNQSEPKKADKDYVYVYEYDYELDKVNKIKVNKKELKGLLLSIYDFMEFRKSNKKPMTEHAIKLLYGKLNKLANDDDTKIKILEQSILNGWNGVFELKNNYNNKETAEEKQARFLKQMEEMERS